MKWIAAALLCIILSGCRSEITNIDDLRNTRFDTRSNAHTVDELLREVFTDEAYAAIKDIPVENAWIKTAMAGGSSIPSSLYQFVIGNGFGRKILMGDEYMEDKDFIGFSSLVHEYTHHLDDMTRDGEGEFINIDSFVIAYAACYGTSQWHGITLFVESGQSNIITDVFGIGPHSERIAYTAQLIWRMENSPLPLKVAYSRIFRRFENDTTIPPSYTLKVNQEFLERLQSE